MGRRASHARAAELAEAREAAAGGCRASQQRPDGRFQPGDELNLTRLREDAKSAALADQEARTQLTQLTERIAELDRLLQDAPDEDQVIEQLALRDRLEASAADAERQLLKARSDRAESEDGARRPGAGRIRRPSPPVRGPRPGGHPRSATRSTAPACLTAWTALATWAAREARSRDQDITPRRTGPPRPGRTGTADRPAERVTWRRPESSSPRRPRSPRAHPRPSPERSSGPGPRRNASWNGAPRRRT